MFCSLKLALRAFSGLSDATLSEKQLRARIATEAPELQNDTAAAAARLREVTESA